MSSNIKIKKINKDIVSIVIDEPRTYNALSFKNLNDLIKIQDNILKNASKILNKNGIIMYITCSLQKIEGERRIEKFLIEQSNFSIIPFCPNEYPLIESCITKEGFLRILPNNLHFGSDDAINGSDGFFVSLLKMDV